MVSLIIGLVIMTDLSNPFEITKNINKKSGHITFGDSVKKMPIFMVNKVYSNTVDSVLYANEVNKFSIDDNQMAYDFYYYALPLKNRFGKFYKKPKEKNDQFIEAIMSVYNYSLNKALDVYDILYPHKDDIMKLVFKGGKGK